MHCQVLNSSGRGLGNLAEKIDEMSAKLRSLSIVSVQLEALVKTVPTMQSSKVSTRRGHCSIDRQLWFSEVFE